VGWRTGREVSPVPRNGRIACSRYGFAGHYVSNTFQLLASTVQTLAASGRVQPAGKLNRSLTLSNSLLYLLNYKQDNSHCMGQKKNPNAQALGKLGGKARAEALSDAELSKIASKGGQQRAKQLSAERRREIAKLAVAARERKRKGK
jgi:hypothetical protein